MFGSLKIKSLAFLMLFVLLIDPHMSMAASTLYQAGLLLNLNNGVFAGSTPLADLLTKGNFGLGASEGATGELVILDGKAYLGDATGMPQVLPTSTNAAFVQITDFKPTFNITLKHVHSLAELSAKIDALLPSKNIFYAIKIDGTFDIIKLRNFSKPATITKIPLHTWHEKYQVISYPKHITGTMVAFRSPNYVHTIAVAGYHLHFISQDHHLVGHVYDLAFDQATVSIEPLFNFSLLLAKSPDFLKASLNEAPS